MTDMMLQHDLFFLKRSENFGLQHVSTVILPSSFFERVFVHE